MLNKKMKRLPFILLTLLIVAACDTGGAFSIPNASSSGSLVSSELLSEATNEEEIGTEGLLFTLTIYEGKQSYVVSGYEGESKDVIIPSTFNNIDVVGVGTIAFASKGIETVSFSDNIKFIGAYAFQQNQLTSVTIPNSVTTIGDYAFYSNLLTSVTIPNSVTTIGAYAFADNQLSSVTIPNTVTTIGAGAFAYNQLSSVSIPDSVTTIGDWAFNVNRLTSLTIPNSVTTIGDSAFRFNLLTSVTIQNSVTTIGRYAFVSNNLSSVTIPNSVTTIGEYSFSNNPLTSVTIPDSVTTIGEGAFFTYKPLTIYVEAAVKPEGWNDYWASSSSDVNVVWGVLLISFGETNGFSYVVLQDNIGNRYVTILSSTNTGDVIIPSTIEVYPVTTIGEGALASNQLTSVTIPNSVTTIGAYAFAGNQLTSVTIPNSVTTIGAVAFYSSEPFTIYVEAVSKPEGWDENWYDGYPVTIIWDYKNQN